MFDPILQFKNQKLEGGMLNLRGGTTLGTGLLSDLATKSGNGRTGPVSVWVGKRGNSSMAGGRFHAVWYLVRPMSLIFKEGSELASLDMYKKREVWGSTWKDFQGERGGELKSVGVGGKEGWRKKGNGPTSHKKAEILRGWGEI